MIIVSTGNHTVITLPARFMSTLDQWSPCFQPMSGRVENGEKFHSRIGSLKVVHLHVNGATNNVYIHIYIYMCFFGIWLQSYVHIYIYTYKYNMIQSMYKLFGLTRVATQTIVLRRATKGGTCSPSSTISNLASPYLTKLG